MQNMSGATILDCLKDPDVSIRQRALELTYQLVNANNVVELVREMLNYLVVAPPEHRALLCSRVSHSATVIHFYEYIYIYMEADPVFAM